MPSQMLSSWYYLTKGSPVALSCRLLFLIQGGELWTASIDQTIRIWDVTFKDLNGPKPDKPEVG